MTELVSLKDRTIVITGAAQGMGKALVELCIDLGANVVGVDMNADGLGTLAAVLDKKRFMPATGSVADPAFVNATVAATIERFGSIEGLVNNAGIVRAAMIEKMTMQQWDEVISVHLTASFLWLQAVGRTMLERAKNGEQISCSIVNTSSDAARKGSIGQINYSAAKAGILGMSMTAAKEWGKYNIRCNSICYGVVETPMTEVIRGEKFKDKIVPMIPMGRWAQPDEVVKTVAFLLSDASSYITGQQISVNGGMMMSP